MEDNILNQFMQDYSFSRYKLIVKKKRMIATKHKVKAEFLNSVKNGTTGGDFTAYAKTNEYRSRLQEIRDKDNILSLLMSDSAEANDKLYSMYLDYCKKSIKKLKPQNKRKKAKVTLRVYGNVFMNCYANVASDIKYILSEAVRLYVQELTLEDYSFIKMEDISRQLDKHEMYSAIVLLFDEKCKDEGYEDIISYVIYKKFNINSFEKFVLAVIENRFNNDELYSEDITNEEKERIINIRLSKSIRRNKEFLLLKLKDEIRNSKVFKSFKKQYKEYEVRSIMLLKDKIPEHMCDMYPLAREMSRHFVLHVGPTNSGKTYESIEKLKKSRKGIYLAPLRLLAYEIYDKLNDAGTPCNMLTGEEAIEIPEANHLSCTIEMLDEYDEFDIAVIDEGQNVGDSQRGGAWTKAILGVRAKEVHICSDDSCVELITKMIEQCNDSYEIIKHERMTSLSLDKSFNRFPEDVKDRDALIVFSKKSVMAVASDLQKLGVSASILYGNLPYDVRLNEVRRFTEGETKVVIATDAIGMGVNLPIKRVVFLETKKFDGVSIRKLYPTEIKQIAGRAGRRGLYKNGLYTAEFGKHFVDDAMKGELPKVERARVNFPESIVDIDMPLSELLRKWFDIPDEGIYLKSILEEDLKLCQELEQFIEDKHLIYRCITIAFDSRNTKLHELFLELSAAQNKEYDICKEEIRDIVEKYSIIFDEEMDKLSLDELGEQYSVYDLLYAFLRKFEHNEYLEIIMNLKRDCSKKMMNILQTEEIVGRTCPDCGKALKWNYPYRQCQVCFEKKHYP